jgi:hypothetical protein
MIKKKVAILKENGKLSWEKTPSTNTHKKLYQRNPSRFVMEKSILYLLEVNIKRLHKAYSSALKIAGTDYALVLMITKGEKGKIFNTHHTNVSNKNFIKRGEEYIKHFELIIKMYGIYVGEETFDGVNWLNGGDFPIELNRIKKFYAIKPGMFYSVNKKLYYLRCYQETIENMFYKAVELAGGERELAKVLATDGKTEQIHIMSFRRLSFKQPKTFTKYAELLSTYLTRNISLFEGIENES